MQLLLRLWIPFFILLRVLRVNTQEFTTTVSLNGPTVVEIIQTDANGNPLETIPLSTLSGQSTTTTPTNTGEQGPIGSTTSIDTTGPAPPTTYVYTTTDGYGSKTLVTTVFTPTFQPTSANPSVSKGTIIAYSDYTSAYRAPSPGSASKLALLDQVQLMCIALTFISISLGASIIL